MRRKIITVLMLNLLQCLSFAAESTDPYDNELPLLHSIDGDRIVVLVTPAGNREIEAGARVQIGDRIRTGPRSSAKIVFNDGTKLLIGRLTELEVQKPAAPGVPMGRLLRGEIRGVVVKAKLASEKPKFMLKTKAAVMGVRGTDFVYEAAENGIDTTLHTLEGSVEVGRTEAEVLKGQGTQVPLNHGVTANAEGISAPQRFNRQDFLASMSQQQPFFLSAGQTDRALLIQRDIYEPPPKPIAERTLPTFEGLHFQMGAVSTRYTNQYPKSPVKLEHTDVGGRLTWHPTLHIAGWLGIRGTFGFSYFSPEPDLGRKVHTHLGVGLTVDKINPIIVEVGPMLEFWSTGFAQPSAGLSALVGWKLSDTDFLERIFASVSESSWSTVTLKTCTDTATKKTFQCNETESHQGVQMGLGLGFNL